MRQRLFSLAGSLLLASSLFAAAFYPESGYYRVQNKGTERYITLIDNRGSINYSSVSADFGAIVTLPNFDDIVDNPGTVIYLNKLATDRYDLQCQGTSTIEIVEHTLALFDNADGSYQAYASQSGVTMYLSDAGPVSEPFGTIATNIKDSKNKRRHWYPRKVDFQSSDSYFGLKPKKMGNACYTTFYASFPYEVADGMTAYFVSSVDEKSGIAIIDEVKGHVPGATPVIIKSDKEGAANNKLNLLAPSKGGINGNKLTGVYFMNDGMANAKHRRAVDYDASTMRVVGTLKDGSVGFVKASGLKYIPANTAYLKVSSSAPAELKMMTKEEYDKAQQVKVTVKDCSRAYGDANPKFEYTVEGVALQGEPQITCEADAKSPVGTYKITATKGTITNAQVTFVNGTLTVTAAPLTVTAADATRVEGEENPAFKLTYAGFKNGETEAVLDEKPVAKTTATKTSAPGEYEITVSGGKAKNYELKYKSGKLTVTKKPAEPVTVTAKSYTRVYGEANPKFEYTSAGAALKGAPVLSCEANEKSPVGTYTIKVAQGTIENENLTMVDGTLTITAAPLTVTAADAFRVEGEDNPEFKLKYDGFKNGETEAVLDEKPVAKTTATKTSPVGEYEITVSGGKAKNYELKYKSGKLTITKKPVVPVTVTAKSYSRVYGEANPKFDFTSEGAELVGTPVLSCEANEKSPVGTYAIKVAKGTIENEGLSMVDGVLTITAAPLTVTAADTTRVEGEENPVFKLTYTGFKNGETETVLDEKPVAKTTATKTSKPGKYEITVSGGKAKNYELKYKSGKLTITPRPKIELPIEDDEEETVGEAVYEVVGEQSVILAGVENAEGKTVVDFVVPVEVASGEKKYNVTAIAENAMKGNTSITTVTIPESIEAIGDYAFAGCTALTSISVCSKTPIDINATVFEGVDVENCTLIVPEGSLEAYKAHAVWGKFNIVEAADPAGISSILFDGNDREQRVYTLGGQRVNATTLSKGIYIVGGRKVIVK